MLELFPKPAALAAVISTIGLNFPVHAAEPMTDDARLQTVTVSATGLRQYAQDLIVPASVLAGDELIRNRSATLGQSLAREPGVRPSGFGPGANRPVIRGVGGPRVRILSNGSEVMDAASVSPDHAVVLEPMLAKRIEILRGPSALAYGGGAVGGVINAIDGRVPTEVPADGVDGAVELRGNTAANEATGAFNLTAGSGNFAFHAEGVKRDARDLRVGRGWDSGRHIEGSFSQAETGSVGASWVGSRGFLGIAHTNEHRDYGLPGHEHEAQCHAHIDHLHCHEHDEHEGAHEDDVPFVDLVSRRWDLRGELHEPFAGFTRLSVRANHTDYRHDEVEEGEIATRFENRAHDARVDLEHAPIAGWRGVLGVQNTRRDFSAVGEEAYVQPTLTRRNAIFLVEEKRLGNWRFEAALRHERQRINVDSTQRNRSHHGTSASLGAKWAFTPGWSLDLSLTRAKRLPSAEELYADGTHLATRTIEIGNPELDAETSRNIDIALRKHQGDTTFSLGLFHNRILDYIYAKTLDEYEGLRLIEYAQRDATFTGIEGEARHRLNDTFALTAFGDHVRARFNSGHDSALPRIPAWRAGLRLDITRGNWEGDIEWEHVGHQRRIAQHETRTPAHNRIHLGVAYSNHHNGRPYQVYARLENLTDELAYDHTSFIKEQAPLPGRSLIAGVRMQF